MLATRAPVGNECAATRRKRTDRTQPSRPSARHNSRKSRSWPAAWRVVGSAWVTMTLRGRSSKFHIHGYFGQGEPEVNGVGGGSESLVRGGRGRHVCSGSRGVHVPPQRGTGRSVARGARPVRDIGRAEHDDQQAPGTARSAGRAAGQRRARRRPGRPDHGDRGRRHVDVGDDDQRRGQDRQGGDQR